MKARAETKLLPIDAVRPSTYNPRSADEDRLELVALSLRKLGFVLPIVADTMGEIVSGHQRHLVATRLGWTEVPVLVVDLATEAERKALNIVFNRGTNDMAVADHSKELKRDLLAKNVQQLAAGLPDCADRARALTPVMVPVERLAETTRSRYDPHMRNMARALWRRSKVMMPVVATADYRVVNGVGRVQYASEKGWKELPVVIVSDEEADFAMAMLNLLSMDFNVHERYADLLRHNSFRRSRLQRKTLGSGFVELVGGKHKWDVTEPGNARKWKMAYGTSIVDFGAGHLHETEILRSIGCHVAAFEPYRLGEGDEISKEVSVALAREFLADVAAGTQYDSVFVSSVFNSVPFKEDREKIVAIVSALCTERTVFHANAMSTEWPHWKQMNGHELLNEASDNLATFALDYEPGIALGDFMSKPKVQKYHGRREFYDLLKGSFRTVSMPATAAASTLFARCRDPIRDPAKLREALAFEFDLPYPDGSRMGLADEAIQAFEKRLGAAMKAA
jgi:hypothetical protein